MAILQCDGCGGDTFQPLSEPGFFKCVNCGAGSTVKLESAAKPAPAAGPQGFRLMSAGPRKIAVIAVLRAETGWGLKEAKAFVDAAAYTPQLLPTNSLNPDATAFLAASMAQQGAVIEPA